jgi:hypothetical protein
VAGTDFLVDEQVARVAEILTLGVVLGVAIDLYRVVSVIFRPGKYLAASLDLLFWGVCALLAFQYLLASSVGARAYMGFALAVGVGAEQVAIGHYVRRLGFAALLFLTKTLSGVITALAVSADALGGAIAWPLLRLIRYLRVLLGTVQKAKIFSRVAGKSRELEK